MQLTQNDLLKIYPYLNNKNVVNIEIKDFNKKGREILLEYDDGTKMAGNLDKDIFTMSEVKGLTSVVSNFARGKYGSSGYRGNCSGLLIKDLLNYYKPDTFSDLAVGSGTSIEVAKELGYTDSNTTFNDLNPKFGGVDISSKDMDFPLTDFIFFHPPYYVFPGSSMPVYSGSMWGNSINEHDGSRISDPDKFKQWFDICNANLYCLLKKGGRLVILMGDSKYKGKYYSMFKEMNIIGELEQVIIKEQHNCVSDRIKYSGKFIPTEHEFLVIIRKNAPYIIPVTLTKHVTQDIRESVKVTWANLIAMILEDNGGKMTSDMLTEKLYSLPKAKGNRFVDAKVRQELQRHPKMFYRQGKFICLA